MKRTALKTLASIAGSLALATTFAGCGSDDSKDADSAPSTSAATTLTAEEFKTQANAICKAQDAAEEQTFTAVQQTAEAGDPAAAKAAVDAAVAVIRGEAVALGALKPPAELQADVDALLTSLNDGLDKIAADGAAAVGALSDPSDKAKALGLTDCGN